MREKYFFAKVRSTKWRMFLNPAVTWYPFTRLDGQSHKTNIKNANKTIFQTACAPMACDGTKFPRDNNKRQKQK